MHVQKSDDSGTAGWFRRGLLDRSSSDNAPHWTDTNTENDQ